MLFFCIAILLIYTHFTPAQNLNSASNNRRRECALLLQNSLKSSLQDTTRFSYLLDILRGNALEVSELQTCITYDAINAAVLDARKSLNFSQLPEKWTSEDVAKVGVLLLNVSSKIAKTFGLTNEHIEDQLPLIDVTKTLIPEICPPFLSGVECNDKEKYRKFDGSCTNLKHPIWGSANTPLVRIVNPAYADGLSTPRVSSNGNPLPSARFVSRYLHSDEGESDHTVTTLVIAWGQFIAHDLVHMVTPVDSITRNEPEQCCNRPPRLKHIHCNEIIIPEDDCFYKQDSTKCMEFVRAFEGVREECRLGSRVQINDVTSVLDANTIYGVTESAARKLRSGVGGLLKMSKVFQNQDLKDLLPAKMDLPEQGCIRPDNNSFCFLTGEDRANEQLILVAIHTVMAREHNRVARALTRVNPHWNDETVFQEARRVVIAEIQHITYNEFLPTLLGRKVMKKHGIFLKENGFWDGYEPHINPSAIDAFGAAAFRLGHSLLPKTIERWSKKHRFIASKRLSDLIRKPFDLYKSGALDEYLLGMTNQLAQSMDDSVTGEVTNHLFKKAGRSFGLDLVSMNIQRGREIGLPGYLEFRKFCNFEGAESFEDLARFMPNETVTRFSSIFEDPKDIDLWSGGVAENRLRESMSGPTFACIIATQFNHTRRGDRFWYEVPNQPSSFTLEQLEEIRKVTIARILCDNSDFIETIQIFPMVLSDYELNPRTSCGSETISRIDFTKWKEAF